MQQGEGDREGKEGSGRFLGEGEVERVDGKSMGWLG